MSLDHEGVGEEEREVFLKLACLIGGRLVNLKGGRSDVARIGESWVGAKKLEGQRNNSNI